MELKCKITSTEVTKYIRKTTTKKTLKTSLIGAALFFPVLLYILHDYPFTANWYFIISLFVISTAYFGLLYFLLRVKQLYYIKMNIKKLGKSYFNTEKSIILDDEGLELKSAIRNTKIPYCEIQSVFESNEFITIQFKAGDRIYIPIVNIINPEVKDTFLSSLQSKTAKQI